MAYHRTKIIEVPIYPIKIKVTIVSDFYDYFDLLKYNHQKSWGKKRINAIRAIVIDTSYYDRSYDYDIVFNSNIKIDIQTLAHETFHLTRYIMTYIGSELSDESEENWAYLHGYLAEELKNTIKYLRQNGDTD